MAIATASGKTNVDFFIEKFDLLDFFEKKNIIYDDGTVKGKPNPDLFLKAIEALGVDRKKSIVFEDSFSGIQAAINSKVSKVFIVDSTGDNFEEFDLPVIRHYDEFDRNLIE